jgi:hypothetical protein
MPGSHVGGASLMGYLGHLRNDCNSFEQEFAAPVQRHSKYFPLPMQNEDGGRRNKHQKISPVPSET